MKVRNIRKAIGTFFTFLSRKAVWFARQTAAIFRPSKTDAFSVYYGKGGTFDASAYDEREAARNQRGRYFRRYILTASVLMGVMTLCAAALWLGSLWKITDVQVEGCVNYAPAAVKEASALNEGDEFLGADAWTVAARIKEKMPLAQNVKVDKHLDGTVIITVTEYASLYYTQFHENYYAIDPEEMQILEVSSRGNAYRSMGAIYVGLPEDARVRVGDTLAYAYATYLAEDETESETSYAVRNEDPAVEYDYVSTVIEGIMEWELSDRVTGMELSDRYAMYLIVDGRIKVQIGKKTDLKAKLALAGKILEQQPDGDLAVILDVSDGKTASVREDATLTLPPWA